MVMTAAPNRLKPKADVNAIEHALRLLIEPGQVVELRALNVTPDGKFPHTVSGYFDSDHVDDMAKHAAQLSGMASGVYLTLNPLKADLLARCSNRVGKRIPGAEDPDVVRRRLLLVDADPTRPAGISASDEEKAAARRVIDRVNSYLRGLGWPEPILADSGNGWHLLHRVDLPADDGGLVRRALHALAQQFDDDRVKIDTKVFNASRITKCYGTLAAKGDDVSGRPHRLSGIFSAPDNLDVVGLEFFEALAGEAETTAAGPGSKHDRQNDNSILRRAAAYLAKMPAAISGQGGHTATFEAAVVLVKGFDLTPEEALPLMLDYNQRCQPPWSEKELQHKLASAAEARRESGYLLNGKAKGKGGPARGPAAEHDDRRPEQTAGDDDIHLTDLGNAQRVVQKFGQDLRYCHPSKQFYVWSGRHWREDTTGAAVRFVKDTQRKLYQRTAEHLADLGDDDDERKRQFKLLMQVLKHALKWEGGNQISASLELVKTEQSIPILPEQMDADPFLLNCRNGTIDLRTGELRQHHRGDYITKICPVEYDPQAAAPLWDKCFHRWMHGNEELVEYLQRVVGYCLTGDTTEQCLWFLYGLGANGKSVFLVTVIGMLGDYAIQAVSDLLIIKHHEAHPTERADLHGRRLVATIETEQGKALAEALTKQLTGGERIRARWCHKDNFEFDATHKIFLAANHKPQVRGTDHGMWRRIKLVPFTVTIPEVEKDPALAEKLKAERPGILAWAVRGCLAWQRDGLEEPDEVRVATAEYRAEQDMLAQFLDQCCFVNPEARCRVSDLFGAFQHWSGDKVMTAQSFRAKVAAKGFEAKPGHSNVRYWHGLGLQSDGN
jgi:P4 family phage/plasmid primase-like protien